MNVTELFPAPTHSETFRRSRERFVPDGSGCYVLATLSGVVLYIGLSNNLRRRMNEHLDTQEKVAKTELGRAAVFFWIVHQNTNKVERTWMNIYIQNEGKLPILNRIYSPTPT